MTREPLPITGDAWEYFQLLKEDLLEELKENVVETIDYHCALKMTMTDFCDMFAHGSREYTTRCHGCGNTTAQNNPFTKLILKFNNQPHKKSSKNSDVCTLDELLRTNTSGDKNVDDFHCLRCNRKTKATRSNCVHRYPRVLCIAINRGSYNDKEARLDKTCVDFPIDTLKLKEHSLFQDFSDDSEDVAYNLVATMYRHPRSNDGSHFTAICKQHRSGMWYSYDDDKVMSSTFTKYVDGIPTARKEFQRHAALLFYIRQEPNQVDASIVTSVHGNNAGSTNSTHISRSSKFTDFVNADNTTNNGVSSSFSNDDESVLSHDNPRKLTDKTLNQRSVHFFHFSTMLVVTKIHATHLIGWKKNMGLDMPIVQIRTRKSLNLGVSFFID
jgi:hypothetical protein